MLRTRKERAEKTETASYWRDTKRELSDSESKKQQEEKFRNATPDEDSKDSDERIKARMKKISEDRRSRVFHLQAILIRILVFGRCVTWLGSMRYLSRI